MIGYHCEIFNDISNQIIKQYKIKLMNVESAYTLPCSSVVPGVEVVGSDVGVVGDVTRVGCVSVVESDEIKVVWV